MNKLAGLAGWAIFAVAVIGFLLHNGRDDLITAQLKGGGVVHAARRGGFGFRQPRTDLRAVFQTGQADIALSPK